MRKTVHTLTTAVTNAVIIMSFVIVGVAVAMIEKASAEHDVPGHTEQPEHPSHNDEIPGCEPSENQPKKCDEVVTPPVDPEPEPEPCPDDSLDPVTCEPIDPELPPVPEPTKDGEPYTPPECPTNARCLAPSEPQLGPAPVAPAPEQPKDQAPKPTKAEPEVVIPTSVPAGLPSTGA